MSEKRESREDKRELVDEALETKLDMLWDNLASRRNCEKTHIPNYLKKKKAID